MRYYELTYIASPELSESDAKNIQQKLISSIQDKEGILDSSTNPEEIELSYLIKKRGQAYLTSLIFYFKSENIDNLKKEIKAENSILRFLLFAKKNPKKVKISKRSPAPVEKTEKKKVELKDIEQKLEEILE